MAGRKADGAWNTSEAASFKRLTGSPCWKECRLARGQPRGFCGLMGKAPELTSDQASFPSARIPCKDSTYAHSFAFFCTPSGSIFHCATALIYNVLVVVLELIWDMICNSIVG